MPEGLELYILIEYRNYLTDIHYTKYLVYTCVVLKSLYF